jgi:hypothetical protein
LADRSVKAKPTRATTTPSGTTPSGTRLVVTVVAGACAALLLVMPRPIPTRELPPLVLTGPAVDEVLARDAAAVAPSGELADRVRRSVEAQGRAEVGEGEPAEVYEARLRDLRAAATELVRTEGEDALDALRAEATSELTRALAGELPREREEAVLGSFPRMLERYGATRDGVVVAPRFVVRVLFAARFDAIVRGDPTARLSPVERRAYWGWLALAERPVPAALRERALAEYARAGGWGSAEATAIAANEAGRTSDAAQRFGELAASGNLRWRNAALALGE